MGQQICSQICAPQKPPEVIASAGGRVVAAESMKSNKNINNTNSSLISDQRPTEKPVQSAPAPVIVIENAVQQSPIAMATASLVVNQTVSKVVTNDAEQSKEGGATTEVTKISETYHDG